VALPPPLWQRLKSQWLTAASLPPLPKPKAKAKPVGTAQKRPKTLNALKP
jgi:hypothetical protein